MANHNTQMVMLQAEKKRTENQSMNAATLRFKVGNAKAASMANAGRAPNRRRSDAPSRTLTKVRIATKIRGTIRWLSRSCPRQRQTVQTASGHTGQVNHSKS